MFRLVFFFMVILICARSLTLTCAITMVDWWWMSRNGNGRQMLAVHEENAPVDGGLHIPGHPSSPSSSPAINSFTQMSDIILLVSLQQTSFGRAASRRRSSTCRGARHSGSFFLFFFLLFFLTDFESPRTVFFFFSRAAPAVFSFSLLLLIYLIVPCP